jgi:hypothetical protein
VPAFNTTHSALRISTRAGSLRGSWPLRQLGRAARRALSRPASINIISMRD